MSVQVMSAVWRTGLEVKRKIVLLKFADHADDDGRNAYPSRPKVAAACGMSVKSVERIIGSLKKEGILIPEGEAEQGRGKTVNYRIDAARAAELYPPVDPKELEKRKKGVRQTPIDEECCASPEEKGDQQTPISEDPERGSAEAEKGDRTDPEGGQSCDPRTFQNHQEPSSAPGRARDPDGAAHPDAPDGEGGDEAAEGDDEPPAPPVNALWREHEAAIRARFGDFDFKTWFADAIPHADKDGVYTLAVPSPFKADMINRQYSRTLASILGRRDVRAEFHPYAKAAAHNRKQAGGAG